MMATRAFPNNLASTYHILTFGCQMNIRDSQWLDAALREYGFRPEPLEKASWIILNTCSVRAKPEAKVLQTMARVRSLARGAPRFVILGCVAQQLGRELIESHDDVALVAGGDNLAQVPQTLASMMNGGEGCALLEFARAYPERKLLAEKPLARSAFVNIMQGCDNFCSYCIVPFTRGRQKSRQRQAILNECASWLANGAVELVLLGQNVNAWGHDLARKDDFSGLLREIAALPGLLRLRFLTSHPKDFCDDVAQCYADLPNLCPDLHLPLQAGSDRVLKAMHRGYTARDYLEIVARLRQARADIALRADLIVGFPGETEADFEETLAMMRACAFAASYSFCYSDRPGTAAEKMPDKIDSRIQLERLARLQNLQQQLTSQWLGSRVGGEADVLIEARSRRDGERCWRGRDQWGAIINIPLEESRDHAGEMVKARITEAKKNSLAAVAI